MTNTGSSIRFMILTARFPRSISNKPGRRWRMDSMVEVLALIPARGGSKGIPRKNIKDLGGHPLIAYSIAAGLSSKLVTRTIVTTDDEEIAQKAKEYGAEVPFLRPEEYAQDDTRDLPVFQHVLSWLKEHEDYQPEVVVQLRPTSPFRSPTLVDETIKILLNNPQVNSVRGVVPSNFGKPVTLMPSGLKQSWMVL